MKISINNDLLKYPLYRDLETLVEESGYQDLIDKLPEKTDYHYSYFEKLWEYLKKSPTYIPDEESKIKPYAMSEIYSWKGTLKIIPLIFKWFGLKVNTPITSVWDRGELKISMDVWYEGNYPQLMRKLIEDYFRFLLYHWKFELIFDNFYHTIKVDSNIKVKVNLFPYKNIDGEVMDKIKWKY